MIGPSPENAKIRARVNENKGAGPAPAVQNIDVSRLAIDDTMWIAKLVGYGALTVAANAYGECCSLMFLSTSGKFRDKISVLQELGDRAASIRICQHARERAPASN